MTFYPHERSKRQIGPGRYHVTDVFLEEAFIDERRGSNRKHPVTTERCIKRLKSATWPKKRNKDEITEIPVGYIYPSFMSLAPYYWTSPNAWWYTSRFPFLKGDLIYPKQFPILMGVIEQAFKAIECYINVKFVLVQPNFIKHYEHVLGVNIAKKRLGRYRDVMEEIKPKTIRIGFLKDLSLGNAGECIQIKNFIGDQSDFGGDVWVEFSSTHTLESVQGTLIHELCHALGLDHPHRGSKSSEESDLRETWGDAPYYTIMSYGSGRSPSFGPHDIQALGDIWGLRQDNRPGLRHYIIDGDDVDPCFSYREISNGETPLLRYAKVIHDKNIFALDCSKTKRTGLLIHGAKGVQRSYLVEGAKGRINSPHLSLMNGAEPTVLIGPSSSSCKNTIIGNKLDNIILTMGGDDTIYGGEGDDVILILKYHGNIAIHDAIGRNKIILPNYDLKEFNFYREKDNLCIRNCINNKTIKIINFFNLLGNYAIYTAENLKFNFWGETAELVDQLAALVKDKNWQQKKFAQSTPVVGYSPTLNGGTLVLRGQWDELRLATLPYRAQSGEIKLPTLPQHICFADAEKPQFSYEKKDFVACYKIDKTENKLVIRDFLRPKTQSPQISCDNKQTFISLAGFRRNTPTA